MTEQLERIYEALKEAGIEILSDEGVDWYWRCSVTTEESMHAFASPDEAALDAAKEFDL